MGAFADRLWRLKREAGDPSYAEMAARLGAAASKSSLAAAARGRTLPSWETAWEFVRVLAVDRLGHDRSETEKQWRELWSQAHADLPAPEPVSEPASVPAPQRPVPAPQSSVPVVPTRAGDEGSGPEREPEPRRWMNLVVVAAVAAVAAMLGAGAGVLLAAREQAARSPGRWWTPGAHVLPSEAPDPCVRAEGHSQNSG
ncbi:hypothetical protein [Melissospora conviva]|uniref:hypothetical protein n=1 Tax=Melissospora conviva TaxID=3388432 RepID=UPI003C1A9341